MIADFEKKSPVEFFIRPARPWPGVNLKEVVHFSDLLWMMVRRDIVARYRRSYLGPVWYLINPLFMAGLFSVVFARFLEMPTAGKAPPFLFYLSVLPIWNYFTRAVEGTAASLSSNAGLFSKVYFPRLIIPLVATLSPLFVFVIQLAFFILLLALQTGFSLHMTSWVLLTPALVFLTLLSGLGVGLWFAAFSVRYRDLQQALGFFLQLVFYVTPILYPPSFLKESWAGVLKLNPMWVVVEGFRKAFLGVGQVDLASFAQAFLVVLIFTTSGLLVFNRVQQNFVDRV